MDGRPEATGVLDQTYRFVALDVETANGNPGSICQLGLALVSADKSITTISILVDPEERFEPFNTNLHGISAKTVQGQSSFADAFQPLRAFLQRHPIIQHSTFDKRAVDAACARYGLPAFDGRWYNSVTIARRAWPELKGNGGHGLASLKGFLGLDFQHHDAAEDARAAAEVVLAAEKQLGQDFTEIAAQQPDRSRKVKKSVTIDGDRNGPLFGHVACFTGKLTLSHVEAATLAAGVGITVKTSVSRSVTLLIVGDQDMPLLEGQGKSSKHRRAEELMAEGHAIRIVSETEFKTLIAQ